jgi:hypothetical protein
MKWNRPICAAAARRGLRAARSAGARRADPGKVTHPGAKACRTLATRKPRNCIPLGRNVRHRQRWLALDRSRARQQGITAAYGYGGNGITISYLAAQLIGGLIAGSTSQLLSDFALDRDGKAAGQRP